MLSPVPLDVIVTILGHHQRPLLIIVPHNTAQTISVVLHCLVVRLTEELVVEHPLREHEPVPLLLPQLDLVGDGGGDGGGHVGPRQHVHLQELDDLIGCDATSATQEFRSISTFLSSYLNACLQESLEMTPTHKLGNLNKLVFINKLFFLAEVSEY